MIEIPVLSTKSSKFSYAIELTGIIYYLDFYWNAREAAWFLTIADSAKINLLSGIRLVPSYLLLNQYRYISGLPVGDLFVSDKQNDLATAQIPFNGFENRFVFLYAEPGEL